METESYEMFDLIIPKDRELKEGEEISYIEVEGKRGLQEK